VAGERKGITYEAFVRIALEELILKRKLPGQVFWNEKPDEMTIEPDFTVGTDKNHPTHVFLVTHSGSAKDSDKKFWRNIGELVEAKVRLPKPAHVYSVVFDSIIKEDLKALQGAAFDGQLLVGDSDMGHRLLRWVEAHSSGLPKDADKKVDAICEAMKDKRRPDNPKALVDNLVVELGKVVRTTRTELDGLWSMERKRPVGHPPVARDTFLRRGVGKLLLLEHPDDIDANGRFKKSVSKELIVALKTMGLAGASIAGPRITDPQILWAIRSLPPDSLAELHKARSLNRVAESVESLVALGGIIGQLSYLSEHWGELTTAAGLFRHLQRCHNNPHKLCPSAAPVGSKRVWLFHLVIEWIKLAGGTRTGYGLAVLVEDLNRLSKDTAHRASVRAILKREARWKDRNTVDRGLRDWHSASSTERFSFTEDDLARVSDVLAQRLRGCPERGDPTKDAHRLTQAIVQTTLEAKLLTYRNFKPFEVLLNRELKKAGLRGTLEVARACFAEAASDSGATLNPLSAGTTVMRVKHTLINWQSAHGSHTNDKRKELCGRASALRYSWDSKKQAFVRRPATERLLLILDGTWGQSDLDELTRAGWDEIFYPDEMSKVIAAIN
jgi:hypothetical protein